MNANEYMNNVLREAEDSSDDFFQSKHINKRKIDFSNAMRKRQEESISKLKNGLYKIRIAYQDSIWRSEEEKLFLKIFSRFHLNETLRVYLRCNQYDGFFLLDEHNNMECFYSLVYDELWVDYYMIWQKFCFQLQTNRYDIIHKFMNEMIKEYFEMSDVEYTFIEYVR